ncbi:MAG: (2Fe-2S)-binding protein [Chloroflexi bacterium]|nr:(2Fe-2S)-binding protein [Chloroflexota bacterium]
MEKIALTIDGLNIVADKGMTVLETALRNGIYIPHLCYHPDLKPSGVCRLCLVEVGDEQLVTSCRMKVEQGMVIKTKSPEVDKVRRAIVELLIADHHTDCRNCPSSGQCELQRIMASLHISVKRMRPLKWAREELPRDTSNPFFDYDPNKCVLCGICVQTCEVVQGTSSLYFVGRGYGTKVAFFANKSRCESCRQCVARCPVGALIPKTVR